MPVTLSAKSIAVMTAYPVPGNSADARIMRSKVDEPSIVHYRPCSPIHFRSHWYIEAAPLCEGSAVDALEFFGFGQISSTGLWTGCARL